MEYLHVKNLEKYHPGYKDRTLQWAKIYFKMVQGDPDCEMIENEIDWGRLIKFILLELHAQKPIPLNDRYLIKKGFNLKKRPISATINMLHNFIDVLQDDSETCVLEKKRVEKNRREESREEYSDFEEILFRSWNLFCQKYPVISEVRGITPQRRSQLKKRFINKDFVENWESMLKKIPEAPFLMGQNDRNWTITFDFIIRNDENYQKILEGAYGKVGAGKSDAMKALEEKGVI